MLFCAKNKRRQTKNKINTSVKILIAITLLTHCFFWGVHSNETKRGTIYKTRVCAKNNKTYSKNLHKKRRLIPSFLHFT